MNRVEPPPSRVHSYYILEQAASAQAQEVGGGSRRGTIFVQTHVLVMWFS